jgi:ferredoxin
VKARVDSALCEGFGACNAVLPEVFVLDEWGYAQAADDGTVPAGSEDLARRAAIECPMKAISLDG